MQSFSFSKILSSEKLAMYFRGYVGYYHYATIANHLWTYCVGQKQILSSIVLLTSADSVELWTYCVGQKQILSSIVLLTSADSVELWTYCVTQKQILSSIVLSTSADSVELFM